jgi:ATP-dependent exoDNAse (exonuclease V) beta subunit
MFEYLLGGAGSRKTSRLCDKALDFLKLPGGSPRGLVLTTYAREAANQLFDRLRSLVLRDKGLPWPQKLDLVNGLDAATIGTNHSLGRAAMEQHWLALGKTPSPEVIDEASRREFVALAADAVPMPSAKQQRLEALALRLGRSETETRGQSEPKGTVTSDVRALIDMISDLGRPSSGFLTECMASVNKLCDELDRLRQSRGFTGTEATFRAHAAQAAAHLRQHPKSAKGETRDTLEAIDDYLAQPTWKKLHKLTTAKAYSRVTKKDPITPDATIVAPLRAAAADYHLFPEFVADLREYVETVAARAVVVHQEYRRLVTEANRVDFADMEQALQDLLKDPARRKAFCSPFGFIGSDESQDMTARSAAAFAAVTEEVGRGAWLADPNQSIYPFRGADHRAVDRHAKRLLSVLSGGASPTPHHDNYRSLPGIIRFVNDLFHGLKTMAVAGGPAAAVLRHLPEDHIQTAPVPPAGSPPAAPGKIQHWLLSETNEPKRFAQVADGVQRLLQSPTNSATGRQIEPEEICIMVRDRFAKKDMAKALVDRGIKVAMRSTGLFESREARVIVAAARLLMNKGDALAEATLWFLLEERQLPSGQGASLDGWLVDRITQAATHPSPKPSPAWLDAIDSARVSRSTSLLSPVSAVVLAIEATGVIGRIAAWGDSFERQSRIDSLIALAASYEKRARAAGRPATVGGFLAECQDRADRQARESAGDRFGQSRDADDGFDSDVPPKDHPGVRLMTCHATKGLGFPITIVADFKLSQHGLSPFEITTLNGMPHVWPDPLKGAENKAIVAIARGVAEGRDRFERKVDAETQLIYVSFTRSQEQLVVAPAADVESNSWLTAVFGESNPTAGASAGIDHFLPMSTTANQVVHTQPAAPLPGGGPALPAAHYSYVDTLSATIPGAGVPASAAAAQPPSSANAIESAPPRPLSGVTHPPRYRSPSDNHTATGSWQVGTALQPIPGQSDLVTGGFKAAAAEQANRLGESFHAFMAAVPSLPPLAAGNAVQKKQTRLLWEKVAARCLAGFLEPDDIKNIAAAGLTPAVMVDRAQSFIEWCVTEFGVTPADWIVEAGASGPASASIGGTWRGRIDLVFVAHAGELNGRRVLVDHKAVMARQDECLTKAGEYVGEVSAYAEALASPARSSSGRDLAPEAIYIHFPLAAAIVPIVKGAAA